MLSPLFLIISITSDTIFGVCAKRSIKLFRSKKLGKTVFEDKVFFDENKNEEKVRIAELNEISQYADRLKETVSSYL
ncbi:MAG: hypothetical protein DRQ49_06615 [Gammaproteobacteria bacterium]|nr:MAG: hypothetical protein DRQ49_06615 [Gammaproteobacteria bacterium]RKZ42556.1 MAG: hypothetical protein DRQ41_06850 [Gammaproteobacteria bacterium]RKZ76861.1 MAG: hypothetical protein DRQ57_02335 [Gammaproteobacteria bacterium]